MWQFDAASAAVEDVAEWMGAHRYDLARTLNNVGAVLLRGFPQVDTPVAYNTVISAALPHLRDYVGGSSPRTQLQGKIMTATETPPDWSIPLHQEMAYTKTGPHRIAFLCLAPASGGGGLSLLGDMAAALTVLPSAVREEFEDRGLRLRRTLPTRTAADRKAGIKKTWEDVFDTEDAATVESVCQERKWDSTWLDDKTLQLTQELMPAIRRHPVSGRKVWHNQAHFFAPACMIEWAGRDKRVRDERELRRAYITHPELMDNVVFGDGEAVRAEQAIAVSTCLASLERSIALQRGDILVVDNILMAHGRSSFRGERQLLVALADEPGWRQP